MSVTKKEMNRKYLTFAGMGVLILIFGVIFTPSVSDLVSGLKAIITHPSIIDFDGLYHGGMGPAFINSGIIVLFSVFIYWATKTDMQGVHIGALMMMAGFSLYGKNILNIIFPMLGVVIHTKLSKKTLGSVSAIMMFACATSPIFSVIAFGTEFLVPGSVIAISFGGAIGTFGGFIAASLVTHMVTLHEGRTLFNAACFGGITAMFINAFLKAFGIGHEAYPYADQYVTKDNFRITVLFLIIFAYFIILGIIFGGSKNIKSLLVHTGKGGNYVADFGLGTSLINIGIMGVYGLIYINLVGGQLNGAVLAALMTAAGFGSAGTSIKQHFPILLGLVIAIVLTGGISALVAGDKTFIEGVLTKISARGMLLCAMYTVGFSPIVGEYGFLAGVFAGVMHAILVPNMPPLHGWTLLYNNGFSIGMIAIFLKPAFEIIGKTFGKKRLIATK